MVAGRVDFIIDSGGSTPSGRTSICAARFAAASESFFTSFLVLVLALAAGFVPAFAAPLSAFVATAGAGKGFTAPGLNAILAAALAADFAASRAAAFAFMGFVATGLDTNFVGTGFPVGFADFDAGFGAGLAAGLAGIRLGVGLECAALGEVLALEDAAARAGLAAFATGRTALVRAALVLRELAMNSYLLQTGQRPVLTQPDPIDGRSR